MAGFLGGFHSMASVGGRIIALSKTRVITIVDAADISMWTIATLGLLVRG